MRVMGSNLVAALITSDAVPPELREIAPTCRRPEALTRAALTALRRENFGFSPSPPIWTVYAVQIVTTSGDEAKHRELAGLVRNSPLLAEVAFQLAGRKSSLAADLLRPVCLDRRFEPETRSRAAAVLLNDFGERDGLEILKPALTSSAPEEFRIGYDAFHQVEIALRGKWYVETLSLGLKAQKVPDHLAPLLCLVANSKAQQQALRQLCSLLGDSRRASDGYHRPCRGRVGDFAAFAILNATGAAGTRVRPTGWWLPGMRSLLRRRAARLVEAS